MLEIRQGRLNGLSTRRGGRFRRGDFDPADGNGGSRRAKEGHFCGSWKLEGAPERVTPTAEGVGAKVTPPVETDG